MTSFQMFITIAVIVLGTTLTRFGAFMLFPSSKTPPAFVNFLGGVLPSAVMGLLVVYSFRHYSLGFHTETMAAVIATVSTVLLHLWRRNLLLSLFVGTLCYMLCLHWL